MLLGRLRIRGKLALLVLIPMVATMALAVYSALEQGTHAARAQRTADAVRLVRPTGELIRGLQQERLLSLGLLSQHVSRAELSLEIASVTEQVAALRALGSDLPADLATALDKLSALDPVRAAAMTGSASVPTIFSAYGAAITQIIDASRLLDAVDGDTPQGRQVIALDAIMRANEGFASLLAAMTVVQKPTDLAAFASSFAATLPDAARFTAYAAPDQMALFQASSAAVGARLGEDFATGLFNNPGGLAQMRKLPSFAEVTSLNSVGSFVEVKIINDALSAADASANLAESEATGFLVASAVALLLAILLGGAVARSVAQPLGRLTQSAERVARLAESELVRVTDDDSPAPQPVRLQPIDVAGRDELGDLARAFERVQETAARLVERQVASRRNVAQMFGHVGRRTQNLVGRQVAIIDKLENDETEPGRLRDLYRLDHVSSRLRRNASSLVVLSGATGADEHMAPVGLGDVIRLALGEIEDYSRVDVDVATTVRVVPALINDLVLLLAELMENATTFSPPATRVSVSAATIGETARLTVVDHGLGMSGERLAEENARLTRRERLDLAPTEVLGLFVIGRLARRHGLSVVLLPTDGGGVTAIVDVPAHLLTAFGPISAPRTSPSRSVDRSRPTLVLTNTDPAVFNVGALNRVTRTLHSVQPWNAFVPPRSTPAELESPPARHLPSPPPRLVPNGFDQRVPRQREGEPRQSPTAPHRSDLPEPSLRQRVPGAQLPAAQRPAFRGMHPPVGPAQTRDGAQTRDPAQARDLVEAFESGVHRAQGQTSTPGRTDPAARTASTLNRRVPGATLSSLQAQARPIRSGAVQAQVTQPPDADQARDSLADFESGVARAMREVDRHSEDPLPDQPGYGDLSGTADGYEERFPGGRGYHEPGAEQRGYPHAGTSEQRAYEARLNQDRRVDEEG